MRGGREGAYLDDGPNASRNEDKKAGLLIQQIEEDHNGAKTSPKHYGKHHTYHDIFSWTAFVTVTVFYSIQSSA